LAAGQRLKVLSASRLKQSMINMPCNLVMAA
jgi:hypothetical protein